MDHLPEPPTSTYTGLFRVAKAKPIRPVNPMFLMVFGFIIIGLALTIVVAAYQQKLAAAVCAASAAILVMWFAVAFLWHSVRQLNEKIDALTLLAEKEDKKP